MIEVTLAELDELIRNERARIRAEVAKWRDKAQNKLDTLKGEGAGVAKPERVREFTTVSTLNCVLDLLDGGGS